MAKKDPIREKLAFEELTQEEKDRRHILGRLYGPIADTVRPTRNDRLYSEQLWEKVFENPIMKEKFANKVMFGELGHPEDRNEIDPSKVAVCMPEPPKKDSDGHLIAYFDILDTPNGRILKTLCDYGSTLGISSRGTGDIIDNGDGEEIDPDTYDCECWDVVLIPAVESARLKFTEGLSKKGKSLTKALKESLAKASDEDRVCMNEALSTLGITLEEDAEEKECNGETQADKRAEGAESKKEGERPEEAVDDGSDELIANLKESIRETAELKAKVKALQEELAVSSAKVGALEEELGKRDSDIAELRAKAEESSEESKRVSSLEESLKAKDRVIEALRSRKTNRREHVRGNGKLAESIKRKDDEIASLKESLEKANELAAKGERELNERLEKVEREHRTRISALESKVAVASKRADGYRRMANDTVNRYIESKAVMLGVKPDDIRARLPESYTLEQVDKACDDEMSYELNLRKVPFHVDRNSVMRFTENKLPTASAGMAKEDDDYVDEATLALAGLK